MMRGDLADVIRLHWKACTFKYEAVFMAIVEPPPHLLQIELLLVQHVHVIILGNTHVPSSLKPG